MNPFPVTFLFAFGLVLSACGAGGGRKAEPVSVAVAPDTAVVDTPQPAAEVYSVALTGDIMMGTTYPAHALPENEGYGLFRDVKDILERADIAAGNLEGTLCDTSSITKKKESEHSYSFRTPVRFADIRMFQIRRNLSDIAMKAWLQNLPARRADILLILVRGAVTPIPLMLRQPLGIGMKRL